MAEKYLKAEDVADAVLGVPKERQWMVSLVDVSCAIAEIPAADVRPVVRGKWKRVDPRSTVVTFRCSECNYYAHVNATNFCPNCGADMRDDETAIS